MREDLKLNHLYTADGNAKWHSHFERQFGNFLKANYLATVQPRNCTPKICPREMKAKVHTNFTVNNCS